MNIFSKAENYISWKSDSDILIAIFGILYLASQLKIASIIYPLGIDFLHLQTTLSDDTFKKIVSGWIASGQIDIYYMHFCLDNLHPAWYSIFLSLLTARAFKINDVNPNISFLILMPFLAGICDLTENMMHLYFLGELVRATPELVAFSGTMTNIKWLLSLSGVAIAAFFFCTHFVKKFIIKP
jgi:hypothetical protein